MSEMEFLNFLRKVIVEEIEILKTTRDTKEREIAHSTLTAISQIVKFTV